MKLIDERFLTMADAVGLLQQLNMWINNYNRNMKTATDAVTALEDVTVDEEVNKLTVASVTSDYDLMYTDAGEIITDG